eukprot:TRINITY_DN14524_c0_g1_i1.p1 TRINITY_DN14524_c0_g1~~TRINITY_DN14524_c0_g1_i1.p1  ORF type:complete len:195 (+),score=43.02 TRINITY_DN14524_c0_g1_i1:42-626(+)
MSSRFYLFCLLLIITLFSNYSYSQSPAYSLKIYDNPTCTGEPSCSLNDTTYNKSICGTNGLNFVVSNPPFSVNFYIGGFYDSNYTLTFLQCSSNNGECKLGNQGVGALYGSPIVTFPITDDCTPFSTSTMTVNFGSYSPDAYYTIANIGCDTTIPCSNASDCGDNCNMCNSCRISGSHPPQIGYCCGASTVCNC